MKKAVIEQAVKIAREKLDRHPERNCHAHYSFIVQNGKIVEWATNSRREPPKHWGYHRKNDQTFRPKFHAETFAYRRAKGLLTENPFEIINIRLSKGGDLKLSKPCRPCYELLKTLGCKCFYYSSTIGFLKQN